MRLGPSNSMSDSDKGQTTLSDSHHEHGQEAPKKGCKAHCKRFWWVYLIATVVVIVLAVVLIIFVAVPKIAQSKMNSSELSIESIQISETEPKQYRMQVESTIRTDGKIHATVDGFRGVMYLEETEDHTPFATIDFPQTTAEKESKVSVNQIVKVENMDAFTQFNTWLLANETLKMTIEGDTKVHVKGLSKAYGVNFKKTVDLKGLNGFHGLNVIKSDVRPAQSTDNYNATVAVPNASIMTIDIGNATFENHLDGTPIGLVYMYDLVLKPGKNEVAVRGDMKQLPVITALTSQPYCKDFTLPFELRGKNVTRNGEEIPYFSKALQALTNSVKVDLDEAFLRAKMELTCLDEED